MKKLITICAVVSMVLAASPAQALVTFDFEGATTGGSSPPGYVASANQRVTDYMTGEYGSSVTATGAAAWENSMGDDWLGKSDTDQWLRTYGSASVTPGFFQISFDAIPITGMSGDFYVFEATIGEDFVVKAYDSTYGDRYSPSGALVAEQSWNFGTGAGTFNLSFSSPVSLLVFSDSGWYDIAIDDLTVTPIPAPGAILLGSIGVGLVGWLRRRRTL